MPHHPEDKDDRGAANADGTGVAAGENADDKSAASAEASALADEESSHDYEADAIDVGAAPPPLLPPAQCTVAATSESADFLDALGHDDMGRRELFGNEGDASPPVHKPPSGRAKNKDDDGALTRNPSKGRGRKKKVPNDHTKCQVKGCPSFPPIVDVCVCAEPSCEKTVHVACYNNLAGKYKVVVMEEHVFCTVTCQKKFQKSRHPRSWGGKMMVHRAPTMVLPLCTTSSSGSTTRRIITIIVILPPAQSWRLLQTFQNGSTTREFVESTPGSRPASR